MWQLTQTRSQNSNYLSVGSNSRSHSGSNNNFRQFGRRISYHFTKVIRKWRSTEGSELLNISETVKNISNTQNNNSINDVLQETSFTKEEIKFIYRDFKQKCPSGFLTEETLAEIYSQFFPLGDCTSFAKHLFAAILYSNTEMPAHIDSSSGNENRIYFKDFVIALSIITRGSLDERIKWVFNLYDLDKDNRISQSEVESMVFSVYDLMGKCVSPAVDETNKQSHVNYVLKKLGLDKQDYLYFQDFNDIFQKDPELMEFLVNVV